MKIFADKSHCKEENRKYLIEILRPVWNKKSIKEKIDIYGEWITRYTFTEHIKDADVCFLPMKWDFYVENGLEDLAQKVVDETKKNNKPLILINTHDFTPKLPFSDIILFSSFRLSMS